MKEPDTAVRVWEGTPAKYLKKAAEVIRLGRGKPKFFGDRKALQMVAKAYPDRTVEDYRDYAVMGCTERNLPHITMQHSLEGQCFAPKWLELVLNNGKCALCGKQIGLKPATPGLSCRWRRCVRHFESRCSTG